MQPELQETHCVICGPFASSTEVLPATIPPELEGGDFSARKLHKKMHYRIVRCNSCGLMRSDPVFPESFVNQLYGESGFDYGREAANLNKTYLSYFSLLVGKLDHRVRIMDVGCGNGFFLHELWKQGYRNLRGYEPSADAVAKAPSEIRDCIINAPFTIAREESSTYNAICCFHTIDHLARPDEFLRDCLTILKPGGTMYLVTHNADSPVHRIFGEHSVMFDVQHFYLFSIATLSKLLSHLGYVNVYGIPITNTFSVAHLAHMSPLPEFFKHMFSNVTLSLNLRVGNMALVAQASQY